MPLDKSKVHKILLVSLTNIGDVILTFPVIDVLKQEFFNACLTFLIGPKAHSLVSKNPHIHKIYIYDKQQSIISSLKLIMQLRAEKYDLVIDLRNTAMPFFIGARYQTPYTKTQDINLHMKDKHLERLKTVVPYTKTPHTKTAIFLPGEEKKFVEDLAGAVNLTARYALFAPGAANHQKRWNEAAFARVGDYLANQYNVKTGFVGSQEDRQIAERIGAKMRCTYADFCGKLNLIQLACLMKNTLMLIANDSAPMHLASYLDVPVIALFGPSNPKKYGPWGARSLYIHKNQVCPGCQFPQKNYAHNCLHSISSVDVIRSFDITSLGVVFKNA